MLEGKDIPKILFWLVCLGASSYVTVWIVMQIKNQISQTINN